MQRRRPKPKPRNVFGARKRLKMAYLRTSPTLPPSMSTPKPRLNTWLALPKPTPKPVPELTIEQKLITEPVFRLMTKEEEKGLGLLVEQLQSARGSEYWEIRRGGLISTYYDGVAVVMDVSATVRGRMMRNDHHLQVFVLPGWEEEWRCKARKVCLLGSGATATDFAATFVMLRNANAWGTALSATPFPRVIRNTKETILRRERDRRVRLRHEAAVREAQRELDELERRRRDRLEPLVKSGLAELEALMDGNPDLRQDHELVSLRQMARENLGRGHVWAADVILRRARENLGDL